jgi:hypothetical protein
MASKGHPAPNQFSVKSINKTQAAAKRYLAAGLRQGDGPPNLARFFRTIKQRGLAVGLQFLPDS